MVKCKKCNREATWKGLCDLHNEEKALVEESDRELKESKKSNSKVNNRSGFSFDDLMRM